MRHEVAARQAKALRIRDAILAAARGIHPGLNVQTVERWTDQQWTEAAVGAGQRPPSAETRELVLYYLRSHRDHAPCSTCGMTGGWHTGWCSTYQHKQGAA